MTDKIALGLAIVLIGLLALDARVYDWGNSVFLIRRFTELTEYLAFWR